MTMPAAALPTRHPSRRHTRRHTREGGCPAAALAMGTAVMQVRPLLDSRLRALLSGEIFK